MRPSEVGSSEEKVGFRTPHKTMLLHPLGFRTFRRIACLIPPTCRGDLVVIVNRRLGQPVVMVTENLSINMGRTPHRRSDSMFVASWGGREVTG